MTHKFNDSSSLGFVVIRRVCIGLILAIIVGVSIVAIIPTTIEPTVDFTYGDPIIEQSGYSVSHLETASRTEFCILNHTPTVSNGWMVHGHSDSTTHNPFLKEETFEGSRITASRSEFSFFRMVNIPLYNIDQIQFGIFVEVISGAVILEYTMYFYNRIQMLPDYATLTNSAAIRAGEDKSLISEVPISQLQDLTSDWMVQGLIRITVHIENSSIVLLHNAVVNGSSSSPISMITFDAHSSDNSIFFENSYMPYAEWYPTVNLTNDENGKVGMIVINGINETVVMTSGNYSGIAGWHNWGQLLPTHNITITLEENEYLLCIVRYQSPRIYLKISPLLPGYDIDIQTGYGYDIYKGEFVSPLPEFVYIPGLEMSIHIYIGSIWRFTYLQSVSIESNGTFDLILEANFPYFSFLGFALAPGEVVLIIFGIALILSIIISLYKYSTIQNTKQYFKDPRIVPLSLLTLSMIMPWFVRQHVYLFAGGPELVHHFIMGAIPLELAFVEGSSMVPTSYSLWIITPIDWILWMVILVMIWIPYYHSFKQISKPLNLTMINDFSIGLIVIAIYGSLLLIVNLWIYSALPFIGLFLVILAPISWILIVLIYRISGKNIDYSNK